ncbi:MAG TPA: rhodanese-like domain-containing protein [Acidimicrobiia bacterium]|nr:rhodanese-like domain-containing protein [Acidimicrobiia bacterium]
MPRYVGQRVPQIAIGGELADDVFVDVRDADEYGAGHAPDARSIPLDQLEANRFTLPMNRRLVAMSRTGERGADATVELREMGFQAVNYDGGLEAWVAGGNAIVTGDGGPGRLV